MKTPTNLCIIVSDRLLILGHAQNIVFCVIKGPYFAQISNDAINVFN